MVNFKDKKILFFLLFFLIFNFVSFVSVSILIDKTADRVINKLKKDYSPSPYGPGFDPDKISTDGLKTNQFYFEQFNFEEKDSFDSKSVLNDELTINVLRSENLNLFSDNWRINWEADRGFNHLQ